MTLFTTCLDLAEKVIKQQTLSYSTLPILATLRDASDTNITNTLFGISSLNLGASHWNIAANLVTNILDINFGAAIANYASPIYLKLVTSDGIVLASSLLDAVAETGSEMILYANSGVSFTFTFGSTTFTSAVLNLIFKGVNNFPSGSLSAKYFDATDTLQATILLTSTKWSRRYTGTLGEFYFEYGNTQNLPSINSIIDLARITDASNNVWFEFPLSLPTNLKPNAILYSNSLVLRIPDPAVDLTTYTPYPNNSSFFHVTFNGELAEKSSNAGVLSQVGIGYESEAKLFGTESLVCGATTNVQYSGVTFPNEFTLNTFFNFTTATTGRTIVLAEKNGVFKLAKTAANNLEVSVNGSVVITTSWTPSINAWQHVWVQKSATQLTLRVNSADIDLTVSYATTIATNNNSFSVGTTVLGLCNGIYIESGSAPTFMLNTQPLAKRAYDWANISFYEWISAEFPQLIAYQST